MKQRLPIELELAVLRAVGEGLLRPEQAREEEFSLEGQQVLASMKDLYVGEPLSIDGVILHAQSVQGFDPALSRDYVVGLEGVKLGDEIVRTLRVVRDKQMLVALTNEAGEQLSNGNIVDPVKLKQIIEGHDLLSTPLVAMEKEMDSIAEPVDGWPIASLPTISEIAGGLHGYWVIAGEPGMGKSTLAWQFALEAGRVAPVLYYDLDATGKEWLAWRTRKICKGDMEMFDRALSQIYYRPSISSLEDDLRIVPAPALVVIDSLQTLPTSVKFRRTALDQWLHRLKEVVHRGYTVLGISEKPRLEYGKVGMGAFKESGEIEYACSVGAQLEGDPDDREGPVKFWIVKNRHRKKKGYIATIRRCPDKGWWFIEGETCHLTEELL